MDPTTVQSPSPAVCWPEHVAKEMDYFMDLFCDAHTTMQRYEGHVRELQRLFVFHGLSCGLTDSFGTLGAKLAESKAFRTDISALARSVRDEERGMISADEMLTVVALAIGGTDLVEGRSPALGVRNATGVLWVLLDAIGGWKEAGETGWDVDAGGAPGGNHSATGKAVAENAGVDNAEPERAFSGAALEFATAPEVRAEDAPAPAVAAEPQDRVELALRELKVYLDDIDRRICRLEPHVEDLSQTVQASRERFEQIEREVPGESQVSAMREVAPWGHAGAAAQDGRNAKEALLAGAGLAQGAAKERAPEVIDVGRFSRAKEEFQRGEGGGKPLGNGIEVEPHKISSEPEPVDTEAGWNWAPETMGTAEPVMMETKKVEWRRKIGVGLGIVAVLFAIAGLGGVANLMRTSRAGDAGVGSGSKEVVAERTPEGTALMQAATQRMKTAQTELEARLAKEASGLHESTAEKRDGAKPIVEKAGTAQRSRDERQVKPEAAVTGQGSAGSEGILRGAKVAGKREAAPRTPPRVEEPRVSRESGQTVAEVKPAPVPRVGSAAPLVAPERALSGSGGAAGGVKPLVEVRSAEGKVITARPPVYPAEALRARTEATVVLHAFLAKDGTVRRMDVVKGAYGFNRSAMDAVWGWRYKPEMEHGRPVEAETQITVDYRLR